jgi:hypothetical protein
MFIPDPGYEFFYPGADPRSKRFRIPEPDPHQRIYVFLALKTVSKLSEKLSGMFIPDPRSGFFYHPRSMVKITPDPGSGSATLPYSYTSTEEQRKG